MHRIDAPGHVNNTFTEGNPSQGVAATQVSADILNALQEELCAVIAGSGIALNKADNGQLLAALLARFATLAALNAHTGASAPHSGHATTGALATHEAQTLPHSATSAAIASRLMSRDDAGRVEVVAGTAGNQAINMSQFLGGWGGTNGWQKLPGGLLLQWGKSAAVSNDATVVIAFPIPFTAVFHAQATISPVGGVTNNGPVVTSLTTTTIGLCNKSWESVGWGSNYIYWFAIGQG